MNSTAPGEITCLLTTWRGGNEEALNRLIAILYSELRQAAHRSRRCQAAGQTLQTTALVNEVFLKLAQAANVTPRDRAHFLALCAQVMRRILVDAARARMSAKRGGGEWRVQFDEDVHAELRPADLVRLDDALTLLAQVDARKSKAIEMRFFGGLSVEETAEALGISRETALRDWRFARAWLRSEMSGAAIHE
ncbi:MAG: sigma-70 family RNA polymerase sigma factor [Bryobacteraceae bacterium]